MTTQEKVWIIDSTLRDGLQSPGVQLDYGQRMQIAQDLIHGGVNELEAGIPAMGSQEICFLQRLTKSFPQTPITSWCRGVKEDILKAVEAGTSGLHLSFPVSDILMTLYNKKKEDILRELYRLVVFARMHFDFVSVGAMDATRADRDFLMSFVRLAQACGAHRVRISDTVGIATPDSVKKLFYFLGAESSITLEFHGHNDLGLATANSLAAVTAGAQAVSLTICGVGERAGNARLEEVVSGLPYAGDFTSTVKSHHLSRLVQHFEELSGYDSRLHRPIVGERIFTHESGIHSHGLIKNSQSYCHLQPQDYGFASHRFSFGSHSGSSGIQHSLKHHSVLISRQEALDFLPLVKVRAAFLGRDLCDEELLELYLEENSQKRRSNTKENFSFFLKNTLNYFFRRSLA